MNGAFSCYHVPSHLRRGYIDVGNLGMEKLVTWAHTTPQVDSFELNSPVIEYRAEGKEARCTISMTLKFRDGARSLWDIASDGGGKGVQMALEAKMACAANWGAPLRVFTLQSFLANRIELKNRDYAQAILFSGLQASSIGVQCQIQTCLTESPLRLSQLSEMTGQPYQLVLLACLRMYLAGEVSVPLEQELLGPSWTVQRATCA